MKTLNVIEQNEPKLHSSMPEGNITPSDTITLDKSIEGGL